MTRVSRQELDGMIAAGLAAYDEAVREQWERIRIEPERWRCSALGDRVWAVAITGSQVLWYNDIEEGFNYSEFREYGVIDEYWCNQSEFVDILERFAQRHSEEAWRGLTPNDMPIDVAGPGQVVRRQTTYWDIQPRRGQTCRIHFRDKEELALVDADYSGVQIFRDHPLLLSYTEQVRSLYIAGQAADRRDVASELDQAIRFATSGWRRLDEYRVDRPAAAELLSGGHGLLMDAPTTICDTVVPILERAGLRPSAVGGYSAGKGQQVLVLGRNFIIARAFGFDRRQ